MMRKPFAIPLDPGSMLARIASVFPVGHFQHAVFAAFDPRTGGPAIDLSDLVVLLAWGVGAVVLAIRRFRWEPIHR